jgi:maleate isomerase
LRRRDALFPAAARFAAVGYGCTSATALIAVCRSLGLTRLTLLSPYVEPVSERLRQTLAPAGIETPAFGGFEVAEEAHVVRIDGPSILQAAEAVAAQENVGGVFLSCTNLRTLDVIPPLQEKLGLPVLSSILCRPGT